MIDGGRHHRDSRRRRCHLCCLCRFPRAWSFRTTPFFTRSAPSSSPAACFCSTLGLLFLRSAPDTFDFIVAIESQWWRPPSIMPRLQQKILPLHLSFEKDCLYLVDSNEYSLRTIFVDLVLRRWYRAFALTCKCSSN